MCEPTYIYASAERTGREREGEREGERGREGERERE